MPKYFLISPSVMYFLPNPIGNYRLLIVRDGQRGRISRGARKIQVRQALRVADKGLWGFMASLRVLI
jgi:hypothetical protein